VLLTIINDILDMSRIEAGKAELNPEMVDFGDLASSIQAFMQPIADQKSIQVSYEVENNVPLAYVDFDKLHHILVNLLSNAIKFTPEGGKVWLKIAYDGISDTKGIGGRILMQVRDTGIGIDKRNQREIFERFRQIDSSAARNYNGTGLGLALVKEYSEMHGGTTEVQSVLGDGSTFTVCIPVRRENV
jgi:signal transduction histidine kinase